MLPQRSATFTLVVLLFVGGWFLPGASPAAEFMRGDVDAGGNLNLVDAVKILQGVFLDDVGAFACTDAADVNDSGTLEVTDAIDLLNFLFARGTSPAEPLLACGDDPTEDSLDCASFPPCDGSEMPDAQAFGLPLNEAAVVFVVDSSSGIDGGELGLGRREIPLALENFPETFEFGVVFSDGSTLQFPETDTVVPANQKQKTAVNAFIDGIARGSGSCFQLGLLKGLDMLRTAQNPNRVLIFVGDGSGGCDGMDLAIRREETLAVVQERNDFAATIHAVALSPLAESAQEFLRALAAPSGGMFLLLDG